MEFFFLLSNEIVANQKEFDILKLFIFLFLFLNIFKPLFVILLLLGLKI